MGRARHGRAVARGRVASGRAESWTCTVLRVVRVVSLAHEQSHVIIERHMSTTCRLFVVGLPLLSFAFVACMYKHVGHVLSAIERPDLDQVLSRLRDNTRLGLILGTLFPERAPPCSSLPTPPGVASANLASCRDSP